MNLPDSNKLRILAVDDNRTNLHILQMFLAKLGHEVIVAQNGEEAVARFDEQKPDVVLLDIMMPVMNGFEAARRIKAKCQDRWVPIIFLSALNRDENLVEGLEAGGDDYLTKPISFIVLEAKMRSMQRTLDLQRHAFEAYKRLQVISDTVLEAIITIDTSGMVQASNVATEVLTGWGSRDLVGRNVNVLMPPPYDAEHDDHIRAYVDGGPPRIIGTEREVVVRRKDGSTFPANLGVTEVRLDGVRMFIGVIRDISEQKKAEQKLRENADQLKLYFDQTQNEQQLAKGLLDKQLDRAGLRDPCIQHKVIPAQNFSGDVVAACRSEKNRLYVLLGDATGHGLTAAISAVPVLTAFYRMAPLDLPLWEIVMELNHLLTETMPLGRFVAATLICLDLESQSGEIWVGGTPGALLVDRSGRIAGEFHSTHLPLGIAGNTDIDPHPTCFAVEPDVQLILCSDGLIEAESPERRPFGLSGVMAAIGNAPSGQRFVTILEALGKHLSGSVAADDMTLLLVSCR